jgi:hypothetical protein
VIESPAKIVKTSNAKTRFITVPSAVASDDRFPFKTGETVNVRIDPENKRVIVEKLAED